MSCLPIALITITALVATKGLTASIPNQSNEQDPTESDVETFDSFKIKNLPRQLPLSVQLPREEPAAAFYPPQPEEYLTAPKFDPNPEPDFYQVPPVPYDTLRAPNEAAWNPRNDLTLYFELPAFLTKENTPTNEYPKKYNKDIHAKNKPLSGVAKKQIVLEPINQAQYMRRQKELQRALEKLAKKENQKLIESEKVPIPVKQNVKRNYDEPVRLLNDDDSNYRQNKPIVLLTPNGRPIGEHVKDSTSSRQNVDKENFSDSDKFSRGLSPELTDALGISSTNGAKGQAGERLSFHMAGHDGPLSYKWGYDTGKGRNRQFRYEERDKEGVIKGHFGYYDKEGKFRLMNYSAHPEYGYHVEPASESDTDRK